MIEKLVKPQLMGFVPYNAHQVPYKVKLDANESPYDLPESARKRLAEYILNCPGINRYPDTDSIKLREKLAELWQTDINGIVVGTGSDQIIQVLANLFVGKDDKVLCPVPSFGMYKVSTLVSGGIPVEFRLSSDYSYDADMIIKLAEAEKPKMIFLCTPNNPTGNVIPEDTLLQILKGCTESIIVIDEAYAEFSGASACKYIKEYDNLVILRTFSKAYGLAGVRCGYSISCPALAREINKVKPPYNLSSLTQFTAELILDESETIKQQVDMIIEQREMLYKALGSIEGVEVFPSGANFLLIRVEKSTVISNALEQEGILVRTFGKTPMLENCIRVSVGTSEENQVFLEAFKKIKMVNNF